MPARGFPAANLHFFLKRIGPAAYSNRLAESGFEGWPRNGKISSRPGEPDKMKSQNERQNSEARGHAIWVARGQIALGVQ